MRRGLAGLLLFVAAACLALAAGGWWLQRVAFDTRSSGDIADVVVDDPGIRRQLATIVATQAAGLLGVPEAQLRDTVERYVQASDPAMDAALAGIVADAHARLIGARSEPVRITGEQLIPIVRDERAGDLPPITLPVEEVTALNVVRLGLWWFVPVMAGAGVLAALLGFIAHPRTSEAVFAAGAFLVLAAVALLGLGWLVPVYALPEASTNTWTAVIPAVARHALPLLAAVTAGLGLVGVGLMIASATVGRRRSWDSPVTTSRYSEQRRWSR